ncbi:MAG: nucleotidyltransferase domain-containing protein [Candidatus Aenigmarchaeota archaeon]|nr:nucleotidyltransferase domain-containing protein [Candidatus Aenigmarchaeota archaeon]
MDKREDIVKGIKRFKRSLSKERKVERVIFFGSRAYGKPGKHSDVDIIIVSPVFRGIKSGRGKGLHKHWGMDYPVDFLCYTPEEFERLKNRVSLVREAVKRGIAI